MTPRPRLATGIVISFYACAVLVHLLVLGRGIPHGWINGGRSDSYEAQVPQSAVSIVVLLILGPLGVYLLRRLTPARRVILACIAMFWAIGLVQQLLGTTFERFVMLPLVAVGLAGHILPLLRGASRKDVTD